MKKIIKSILQTISDCFNFTFDLFVILCRTGLRNYNKKEIQNKPVSILANGPSLLDSDFRSVDCEYCLLNDSPISPLFWELRPKYYILADPLYFADNLGEREKKVYEALREKLDWQLILFVPFGYSKKAKKLFSGMSAQVIPFRGGVCRDISNRSMKHFLYRHGLALPRVQNVVIGAIGCLMGKGFKEINLYGVDHSWTSALTVNQNNVVCLKDSHFYEKEVSATPWYKVTGEPYKMYECLRDIANTFASYWDLRNYADEIEIKIYNFTKSSFIDAFDRK